MVKMRTPKRLRKSCLIRTALLLFLLIVSPFSPLHATEYYAFRLAGSDCTLCHTDPKTGSLTPTGEEFQSRGHRYPLLWREVFFYLVGFGVLTVILYGLRRRRRLWQLGKAEQEWGCYGRRWKDLFVYVLGHARVLRVPFPGLSHLLLFGAFLLLGLAVLAMMGQEYLFLPLTKTRLFHSRSYPYLRLLLDLSGMAGVAGTLLLAFRRYGLRPRALDNRRTDAVSLLLLSLAFLTGFLVTGIRNHYGESPFSQWSSVASTVASIPIHLTGAKEDLKVWLWPLWWIHCLVSLLLLSSIPFSRLLHLFSSPMSIFFRNLRPKGALAKIDLEQEESYGVSRIGEFPWKHLLELDACTRCGRCQENCPAFLSGKVLNPKGVVQDLKRRMERSPFEEEQTPVIGEAGVVEEAIWQCTTCRNCLEHCPVFIEPMVKLIEFRRSLVLMQGKIPKETQSAFRNIERKGNPWGFEREKRAEWARSLGVREVSPGDKVDWLYWVGCYGSYDDRNIKVAESLVRVLTRAGLDFGVLGNSEWCCGIDLRRMGSEYLFQIAAEKNIELLRHVRFGKMITTCPHCFNTFRNEYPQFGGRFEVIHYAELIDRLLREGKIVLKRQSVEAENVASVAGAQDLVAAEHVAGAEHVQPSETRKPRKGGPKKVAYHDSCYLGRYNDGYEEPRKILDAIGGLDRVEMERNREKSFCCGGGGCHMWMEERAGKRINQMRVEMAQKTGAGILATVCPLCMISLDSAVKVMNLDEQIEVKDILELVSERLE
jgi:Fe-S oxidoreductase/nitrate reductase gamma subunit